MFKKKARWLWVLVCLSLFLANACAGSLTWFDYSQTGSRENQLGANLKAAHENKNWGQNPKYREAAGPLSGSSPLYISMPAIFIVGKLKFGC